MLAQCEGFGYRKWPTIKGAKTILTLAKIHFDLVENIRKKTRGKFSVTWTRHANGNITRYGSVKNSLRIQCCRFLTLDIFYFLYRLASLSIKEKDITPI